MSFFTNTSIQDTLQHRKQAMLDLIAAALDGLRYGALEIVVHDGRIVQIERKEKLRFDEKCTAKSFGAKS